MNDPLRPGWEDSVLSGLRHYEEGQATASRRYQILEEIGRGGMGVVYRAIDGELNRQVAFKVLYDVALLHPDVQRRFRREGEIMARLSHPNVVSVYDIGEQDGAPFIAMEFVEGETLEKLMARGGASRRSLLEILESAARGVAHAHSQGIIHRDLKPSNIIVTAGRNPKVTDFGLAHVPHTSTAVTRPGSLLGTPLYMSPEQLSGNSEELSPRSDVYSLGVILYSILTGSVPYEGDSILEILAKIQNQSIVPPRHRDPTVPQELETICMKALDIEAGSRYRTAREFAEDIHRHLHDRTILAEPTPLIRRAQRTMKRHKLVSLAAALIVLFGLGTGAILLLRSWARFAERSRHLKKGDAALSEGKWKTAADHFAHAYRLDPADSQAAQIQRFCEEVQALLKEEELFRTRAIPPRPEVSPYAPVSQRKSLWEWDRDRAARKPEARRILNSLERCCLGLLTLRPNCLRAREILRERWERDRAEAHQEGDQRESEFLTKKIARLGYSPRVLGGNARLDLSSEPPGAETYLFRYQERDLRLLPLPCNSAGETRELQLDPEAADHVPMDAPPETKDRVRHHSLAYPFQCSEFNRVTFPLMVRSGSYLVVFRSPEYADVRIPILAEPDSPTKSCVRQLRRDEIPPGFVYVPEGPFISGGDAEAYLSYRMPERNRTKGYLIAVFSITFREYLEYLNDREPKVARTRIPLFDGLALVREMEAKFVLLRHAEFALDDVVWGITGEDAEDFARWYTEKKGNGRWVFRLPTSFEWEKAARGADGRPFPWGAVFDPSFAFTSESLGEFPKVKKPPGLYPVDESPYGVRDCAGVVLNIALCEGLPGVRYETRGGSRHLESSSGRPANRGPYNPHHIAIGFRLAADLPSR